MCVCVFSSLSSDKWFSVLSLLVKACVDEAADPQGDGCRAQIGSAGIGKFLRSAPRRRPRQEDKVRESSEWEELCAGQMREVDPDRSSSS